jgi:hypothetical protein
MSRYNSVGIATDYGLNDRVRFPEVARFFSPSQRPERFWGHPASYPMDNGSDFPGGKAAEAWSWSLTLI